MLDLSTNDGAVVAHTGIKEGTIISNCLVLGSRNHSYQQLLNTSHRRVVLQNKLSS